MAMAVETVPGSDGSFLFDGRLFVGFAAVVVTLMVLVLGVFVWLLVRFVRLSRSSAPGGPVRRQPPGAPPARLERRLHELDDLRRRGVITDDEHRTARSQALSQG